MARPPLLGEGDAVGVVSPASPVAALRAGWFERGVSALETLGFDVRVAQNARAILGHTAGTIEQRLSDLHAMFEEESVRAAADFTGESALELLESGVARFA